MEKTKILLVEDDPVMARIIRFYLSQKPDQEVAWVSTCEEAIDAVRHPFDLLLLDILLPDSDGISLCRTLRQQVSCPIIFISCLDDENTIIQALEMGGDDFLAKPFNNKILQARIDANLRRVAIERKKRYDTPANATDFTINMENRILIRTGKEYQLTPIEFGILLYLMEHEGQTISTRELYEFVWSQPDVGDLRTVVAHIHTLRKKLEDNPRSPVHLHAVYGKGYRYTSGQV